MSRRRPHVLYVTPIFGYPAFGGPRLRTYNTLKALARCADVSLYLTQQPDTPDRDRARDHLLSFCRDVYFPNPLPGPSLARRVLRVLAPPWLKDAVRRWRHQRQRVQTTVPDQPDRDPSIVSDLRAWIALRKPDLIWLGFGGISYDLVSLKKDADTPLVLETECVWSRFILRELPFEIDPARLERISQEGRAKEAEERLGAAQVDMTTAVSEVDAAYFRSIAPEPERVMLLANVIDVDVYADRDAPTRDAPTHDAPTPDAPTHLEQPAVVFAGTLSHGTANVDAALWLLDEVMSIVWRKRPDLHLYVVGRSPAPAIIARCSARVHVTGEVPSIVPYMRASAAALVPLRWESGTRFKILEAFACKTPVVSTRLGAEGLEVEHGQHLLLADDAQSFAGAILALVDDAALGDRLVGPAYDLVRREYDLSSAERQIQAVLARLGYTAQATEIQRKLSSP